MQSLLNEIWRTGRYGFWAFLLGAYLLGLWNACFARPPAGTTRRGRVGSASWWLCYCLFQLGLASGRAKAGVLDWPVLAGLVVSGAILTPILVRVIAAILTMLGRIFAPIVRAVAHVFAPFIRAFAPVLRAVPRPTAFHFAMGMVLSVSLGLAALLAVGVMDLHAHAQPGN